jgi:CRISPR-associated protein Cmr3
MATQWIFIQPHDVWMFRDARPFAAGSAFVARSLFPPPPETVLGALRTLAIEARGIQWPDYYKRKVPQEILDHWGAPATPDIPAALAGNVILQGPFVARQTATGITRLTPMPRDIVRRKDDDTYQLLCPQAANFLTDPPFAGWMPLLPPNDGHYEAAEGWLDDAMLAAYLNGTAPTKPIKIEAIFAQEERIGVTVTGKRTAREHHFYRARMVRPAEDVGLLVGINPALEFKRGVIALGGEGRMGYFTTVDYSPPAPPTASTQVKLLTLTPAYFSGGWQPASNNWGPWVGSRARLISLATGRALPISGWNMALHRPKPQRNLVPPGSVYYFADATIPTTPFTETADDAPELGQGGYGAIAVGSW